MRHLAHRYSIISDVLPTLTASGTVRASLNRFRDFPASLVASRWAHSCMLIPENDTSTGSLETPDAPRSLCTRNKSSVQPNQTGFTH